MLTVLLTYLRFFIIFYLSLKIFLLYMDSLTGQHSSFCGLLFRSLILFVLFLFWLRSLIFSSINWTEFQAQYFFGISILSLIQFLYLSRIFFDSKSNTRRHVLNFVCF